MALVEVDDVAVDARLLERAKGGDAMAKSEIAKALDGLVTYMHALTMSDDETILTVRELENLGIVTAITLSTAPDDVSIVEFRELENPDVVRKVSVRTPQIG